MPEPDRPFHPSCWAFTRDEWRKGRVMSDHPIPGSAMGPGWDPGDDIVVVHTNDGYGPVLARHVVVAGPEELLGPVPTEPPEDWEPGQDEPPAFLR